MSELVLDAPIRRAFQNAFRRDDVELLQAALRRLDEEVRKNATSGEWLTKQEKTLAHEAAAQGAVNCLDALIKRDMALGSADFMLADKRGYRLIHYAAEKNAPRALRWIVEHGYGRVVDEVLGHGFPFLIALKRGSTDAACALLELGSPKEFQRFNDPGAIESYDLAYVLRLCSAPEFLQVYLPSQQERDRALAEATRLNIQEAIDALRGLGAQAQPALSLESLQSHSLSDVERAVAEAVREEVSQNKGDLLFHTYGDLRTLLLEGPYSLLATAFQAGLPLTMAFSIVAKRQDSGDARRLLETLPRNVLKKRWDLRKAVSVSPEAIAYLVDQGLPANEVFPDRATVGNTAKLVSRIDLLLDHDVRRAAPALRSTLDLIPPAERQRVAMEALWRRRGMLDPGFIDALCDAGGATLRRHDYEESLLPLAVTEALTGTPYNPQNIKSCLHLFERAGPDHVRDIAPYILDRALNAVHKSDFACREPSVIQIFKQMFRGGASLKDLSALRSGMAGAPALILSADWKASDQYNNSVATQGPVVLDFLLKRCVEEGIDFSWCGPAGTALHAYAHANRFMNPQILDLLIAHNVDRDARDLSGKTVMEIVEERLEGMGESGRNLVLNHWKEVLRRFNAARAQESVTVRRMPRPGGL